MKEDKRDAHIERPGENDSKKVRVINLKKHETIYKDIECYFIDKKTGKLSYTDGNKTYPLCSGSIIITKEIHKNDGNDNEIFFCVEGVTKEDVKLPSVMVSATDFNSLNWITRVWGSSIVVMPNQTAKLAAGILQTGEHCTRESIRTHTGYIYEDGKPVNYLSASGSIIKPNIECEIDHYLKRYKLSAPSTDDTQRAEAINSSLSLLNAHASEVTGPLLAFVYLAPLLPIVNEFIGDTSFLLYLQGKTQSGKSTLAALALSHYGVFSSQTPPTTFVSTANAISVMAFILKDSVLWIDDYHPQGTKSEADKQNQLFQMLVRMAGDHSTRRRLDSNAKLKESYPPRCVFLATGEDSPKIGHSGHARVFQLDVPKTRKDISALQRDAMNGVLSRAMADYIVYIIENYEEVKERTEKQYMNIQKYVNEVFGEYRLSNQATLLCLSAYMFFDYVVRCGVITRDKAKSLYKSIKNNVMTNALKNGDQLKQEDPVEMYLSAMKDLISNGRVCLLDLNRSHDISLSEREGIIGWLDDKGYYIDSQMSYKTVNDYYTNQNMVFVANPNTLWRQLRDSGYLIPDKQGNPRVQKRIGPTNRRLLWFPINVFESSNDDIEEERMVDDDE